jgi:hypothetical protein
LRHKRNLLIASLVALILVFLAGLTWVNLTLVQRYPDGREFHVNWLAARGFIFDNNNPYGSQVARGIQRAIYGHAAGPDEYPYFPDYPFYILFIYLPFAYVADLSLARAMWMVVLEVALVGLAFLSLRLADWRPKRAVLASYLIFAFLWFYGLAPLLNGGLVILLALFFGCALLALQIGLDEIAGVLLALTTFKWEVGGLLLLFLMVRVTAQRRWRVLAGFFMTLFVLIAAATIFFPGWYVSFLRAVVTDYRVDVGVTTFRVFQSWWPMVGRQLGIALTIVLVVLLFLEWRAARYADFRRVYWTACLTLAATPLLGLRTDFKDFVTLLLPLTLVLAVAQERWRGGAWLAAALLLLVFAGPWLLLWQVVPLHAGSLEAGMFLLLPLSCVLGLYWLRWWTLRPPRTWLDEVSQSASR